MYVQYHSEISAWLRRRNVKEAATIERAGRQEAISRTRRRW